LFVASARCFGVAVSLCVLRRRKEVVMKRLLVIAGLAILPLVLGGCVGFLPFIAGATELGVRASIGALEPSPAQRKERELRARDQKYREFDREYRAPAPGSARRMYNRETLYFDYHEGR
jgi:hypothetical protein